MKVLSDILYFIVYHLVRYRRKVTSSNLRHAYPERSDNERRTLEKAYYHHICDLMLEGIYNLYAHPMSIMKRYRIVNHHLVNQYYERGQSVILMSAHYNNWEYMVTSLNMQLLHHGIGVGKPLNDKGVASFVARKRVRFGTQVEYADTVRKEVAYYDSHDVPCALMMLSDQSPSNPYRSYWTQFLNHDTAFLYGAEYFARKYNYPVLYYSVSKVRRGHYEVTFSPLCEDPSSAEQYTIVEQYARRLEKEIREQPEYWLWSHRRWKLTRNGRIMKDGSIKILKNPNG